MAGKVEAAAAAILKDELSSLEEWIQEQQRKLKEEISKIEEAYEANRKALVSTGAFSDEEVKSQLSNVQKKADDKKVVYDSYDALLVRSKDIYS
jgi:septation ring formation regulator EzrA